MKKIILTLFLSLFFSNVTFAEDRFNAWVFNDTKISEKCLKTFYPQLKNSILDG